MHDSTVVKVDSKFSPIGPDGQVYLAMGKHVGMRKWHLEAGRSDPPHARDYEYCGLCQSGKAELKIGSKTTEITPGSSVRMNYWYTNL
jgi:quercetin dioxygenase-like cupin family protein